MKQYLENVSEILQNGQRKDNRTGTPTIAIFGSTFRHKMDDGFPLLTTKKIPFRLVASELEFFMKGITDKRWLQARNNHIWDDWASPSVLKSKYSFEETDLEDTLNQIYQEFLRDKELMYTRRLQKIIDSLEQFYFIENNVWKHDNSKKHHPGLVQIFAQYIERDLGPIYGWQWRHFGTEYYDYTTDYSNKGVDQIKNIIEGIASNPNSRRFIVTSWAPHQSYQMALAACHYSFQVDIMNQKLHLLWTQRSVDTMLGLPFNIASYALLLHLLSLQTGYAMGTLIGNLGDTHIYENHIEGAKKQITRNPFPLSTVKTEKFQSIFEWSYKDSNVENYQSHEAIRFNIAI